MNAPDILSRLHGVKRSATGWTARCPAHDDRNASLSLSEGEDGRILIHCHAGCSTKSVVGALGLTMVDLFPFRTDKNSERNRRIRAIYDYTDEQAELIFQTVRYEPKKFSQRRPDRTAKGGWVWNLEGVQRVLYRLPDVLIAKEQGETVFVCEGEKDCDAMAKAGLCGTCNPMGAGKWLPEHTETLIGAAKVVIIADKDHPGRKHAQAIAAALRLSVESVKVLELPDHNGQSVKDASDFLDAGGTATWIRELIAAAPEFTADSPTPLRPTRFKAGSVASEYLGSDEPAESDEEIGRLATMPPLEYERARKSVAKKRGCRTAVLDQLVQARRQKTAVSESGRGEGLTFLALEPWPDPVNGAALLNEIHATLRRYVVASDAALSACALFALHTYAFDLGDISPILFVTAPSKRCGKSRVLQIQARLVNRPLATSSASPAGIYRAIELHHPTLLIDEVDAFLKGDDQLRGLINSGHTRDAAFHLGCVAVGDNFEPRRWSTWAPKIFSGIGKLADTIEDRAIVIPMRRRRKDETAERLRYATRFDELRRKCGRFVGDNADAIRAADPQIPDALNDRAADNWTPLLSLADLAGGHWPDTARRAALQLSGDADTESGDTKTQLLADIKAVFEQSRAGRIASTDLCERLAEMEGRPWAEYGRSRKPISPNQLAYLLRDPKTGFGIISRTLRIGDDRAKGYDIADFDDAFGRYLPETGITIRDTVTTRASIGENGILGTVTPLPCHGSENATSANEIGPCHGVTDHKRPSGQVEAEELLL